MDGRNFRFRFSLRTLLLVMTALCIGPGGWIVYKREQTQAHRHARRELDRLGVNFGGIFDAQGKRAGPRPFQPAWERFLFGYDLSEQGNVIFLHGERNTAKLDQSLDHCRHLPNLYCLYLSESNISDAGLSRCEKLTQLEELSLRETQISDAGLVHLAGLTHLNRIDLRETQVTEQGVNDLQRALPGLEIFR